MAGRLYMKARHMGYRRAKRDQTPSCSILELENVNTQVEARCYLGKRVAYVYKVKSPAKGKPSVRTIWGKITRPHGSTGKVRASFARNLPPQSFGAAVRVMLFPSNI